MPDRFHTQEAHSGSKDAGCCPADENHVPQSKTIPEFPEVKLSFSVSGILLFLLVCYKKTISPLLPQCCRFTPTCSAYAAEAIIAAFAERLTPEQTADCQ